MLSVAILFFFERELEDQLRALRLKNRTTQSFKYTKESAANMKSGIRQFLYCTVLQTPTMASFCRLISLFRGVHGTDFRIPSPEALAVIRENHPRGS